MVRWISHNEMTADGLTRGVASGDLIQRAMLLLYEKEKKLPRGRVTRLKMKSVNAGVVLVK